MVGIRNPGALADPLPLNTNLEEGAAGLSLLSAAHQRGEVILKHFECAGMSDGLLLVKEGGHVESEGGGAGSRVRPTSRPLNNGSDLVSQEGLSLEQPNSYASFNSSFWGGGKSPTKGPICPQGPFF